jgi:hypothetical protein
MCRTEYEENRWSDNINMDLGKLVTVTTAEIKLVEAGFDGPHHMSTVIYIRVPYDEELY